MYIMLCIFSKTYARRNNSNLSKCNIVLSSLCSYRHTHKKQLYLIGNATVLLYY